MKAPFPWFGGKRRVAHLVWAALGDVPHYVEPFAGSLACLLERPAYHEGAVETVNDLDCFVANFWRALAADPALVARHASDPVNEADLFARHMWLVNAGKARIDKLNSDPHFYDAKVAGWWVWGQCAWIGSGWCSGTGPWVDDGQRPHLGNSGQGVNRKLPHLGDPGRGVNRKLPHLGDPGRGVAIEAYLSQLAVRLSRVRVCCGDWSRVVTDGATSHPRGGPVGVFLDPPYLADVRTEGLYSEDDGNLAHAVRDWAVSKGDDPRLRIVLAGYEPEHEEHVPATWRRVAYSAMRAYGTAKGKDTGNRHLERLWLSPGCVGEEQGSLFA